MSGPLRYISEPEPSLLLPEPERRSSRTLSTVIACAVFSIFLVLLYSFVFPPKDFPVDSIASVESGETLSGMARNLENRGAIKSEFAWKAFVTLFAGSKGLVAGDYYLEAPQNSIILAWRLSRGSYDLRSIRVTIPEGTSVREISELFTADKRFTRFDARVFIALAAAYEGYLFPDTYLFLPNIDAESVIDAMLSNYKQRIESLTSEIKAFGRPIKDVIKMASIIEEEARTSETRRTIAGILWKRLDEGMPLQVDAAFAFVNGEKDSALLSLDDLKIDSPYNTYVYKGLPPTPISNPGLDAILSTITPIKTAYYYYLSDKSGNMHYAKSHEEHVANKDRYLR